MKITDRSVSTDFVFFRDRWARIPFELKSTRNSRKRAHRSRKPERERARFRARDSKIICAQERNDRQKGATRNTRASARQHAQASAKQHAQASAKQHAQASTTTTNTTQNDTKHKNSFGLSNLLSSFGCRCSVVFVLSSSNRISSFRFDFRFAAQ